MPGTVEILVDCAQKHFDVDTLKKMILATNLLCKLIPLHLAVDGGNLETAKILSDYLKMQFHQKNLRKIRRTLSDSGEQIPCLNLLEPKNKRKSRKQSRVLM